ncbi:MAG TPA: response regulator [Armatimonadota bacterium]|jgi:two-component system phosphate regulon response regulator PhoB
MRHTVLVIDDQWSMQELARIVLHTAGYRVLFASDAITGLCLARTEHPDLIVLDDHLTDQSGVGMLDQLRRAPKTATIPVIIIATNATFPDAGNLASGMVSRYLRKPFHPPELLHLVDHIVQHHELPIAV